MLPSMLVTPPLFTRWWVKVAEAGQGVLISESFFFIIATFNLKISRVDLKKVIFVLHLRRGDNKSSRADA